MCKVLKCYRIQTLNYFKYEWNCFYLSCNNIMKACIDYYKETWNDEMQQFSHNKLCTMCKFAFKTSKNCHIIPDFSAVVLELDHRPSSQFLNGKMMLHIKSEPGFRFPWSKHHYDFLHEELGYELWIYGSGYWRHKCNRDIRQHGGNL